MKAFSYNPVQLPSVEQVNTDHGRFYVGSDGSRYPSVTTVLDVEEKPELQAWKEAVGETAARQTALIASRRGTVIHEMTEAYLQGHKYPKPTDPGQLMVFKQALPMFMNLARWANKHLGEIIVIEGQMVSHSLRVGGTTDIIAEVDGVLSILDWKQSNSLKTEEMIHTYFMQQAAYAVMYEETMGVSIENCVTAITTGEGMLQIFKQQRSDWVDEFKRVRNLYDEINKGSHSNHGTM